ncbi:hypothetical protein F442_12224 [Phytophthora nicotianae P10297]|uniref:Uncharacterized protein n=3 Tax=Phytophthora nicotianae TaxID=4792 RepID=W2PZ00_PHYN3|nr:hypothetical protein PPTG_13904 [Phytophthora nicotianae INRA-310]ETN06117.1 hypothetical protein PPTG_13904 [Phytophthora nicotianae INRA-310]ETO71238.1 hypothetical protein F444_12408 [Phytophthora nicotianae P1976]ETP40463.1 hypothetical protein F442_12224 [Phytophthora nicotianae P10297]
MEQGYSCSTPLQTTARMALATSPLQTAVLSVRSAAKSEFLVPAPKAWRNVESWTSTMEVEEGAVVRSNMEEAQSANPDAIQVNVVVLRVAGEVNCLRSD